MFSILYFILGIGMAHASEPLKQYVKQGSCDGSFVKSIEGMYDLSCHNILIKTKGESVFVDVVSDEGTEVNLTFDKPTNTYKLTRIIFNRIKVVEDVKNFCVFNKNNVICDSYTEQEHLVHINFKGVTNE